MGIDDIPVDDEFADVVQVTGDGDALHLLIIPSHFAGDDLAVFTDALRVALRVLIFTVNGGREGAYGITINRAEIIVEAAVLLRALLDLGEQAMIMNADAVVRAAK